VRNLRESSFHSPVSSETDYEAFFDRAFEVLMALKFPTLVGLTEIPLEIEGGFIYYPALLLDD